MSCINPNVKRVLLFDLLRYWYPLNYMLSLALAPSAFIGVNADMALPKMDITCGCKPSLFAYPTPVTAEVKEVVSRHCNSVSRLDIQARRCIQGFLR